MISLRSEITKKILNFFFLNPDETLYVNELSRNLNLDKRNLVKKIKELETDGILIHHIRGNLKLYSIDKTFPLYQEYRKIILKTIGFEEQLRKSLKEVKGIKEAYIYGSYARDNMDAGSDIDLLVVGKESLLELQKRVNKIQKEIGREINLVNMDEAEFRRRVKEKEPFISGLFKQQYIRLI